MGRWRSRARQSSARFRRIAAWSLTSAAVACGGESPDAASQAVVLDSAGVTIVESPDPGRGRPLDWSLGAEPVVSIGALEGAASAHQLYRVRDAFVDPAGRIVVADGGSAEIRVFDAAGGHVVSWGGEGAGPGEFRALDIIGPWAADSIVARDRFGGRLSFFDRDGALGRTLTLGPVGGLERPRVVAIAPGELLVVATVEDSPADEAPEGALARGEEAIAVVDGDGFLLSELGTHPGFESATRRGQGLVVSVAVPFARGRVQAVSGDGVMIAATDRLEVRLYGRDGGLERIHRIAAPLRAVTEEDVAAEAERIAAEFRAVIRDQFTTTTVGPEPLADLPAPDFFPQLADVKSDPAGYSWLLRYRPPFEAGPGEWIVLDRAGVAIGVVETPEGLEVLEVGPDYLLGLTRDELEVEYVQLWRLVRPGL